ncbi:hypothetical protein [Massilia pseudoviolaceinigra]|uniref:hypothetical protein n=1 Tax=Massilia pseudoviolaceinigra TaxID=3057165 RepID=UPI002796C174|nr:hypothetical protein [Massilia sp. CCM 9206]MDQ1921684.1 hypothetical protein [Massilia sp. CCM 9206]
MGKAEFDAIAAVGNLHNGADSVFAPAQAAFDRVCRLSAAIVPANVRFAVSIKFADGDYTNHVTAATEERALGLALTDARMGSPFGSFFGKVLSSNVVAA